MLQLSKQVHGPDDQTICACRQFEKNATDSRQTANPSKITRSFYLYFTAYPRGQFGRMSLRTKKRMVARF